MMWTQVPCARTTVLADRLRFEAWADSTTVVPVALRPGVTVRVSMPNVISPAEARKCLGVLMALAN